MTLLTVIAGMCGLVEGVVGGVGALIIFLCVDYPELLITDYPAIQLRNNSMLQEILNITNGSKLDLDPVTIMASGYSSDPDREIIFCFSILSSSFGAIWVLASLFIFLGSWLRSARLLWFWVLSTMAVAFLDIVGAVFFANKTGGYILFYEETEESLFSDSTISFLKYQYPIILLIVFGRGLVTVPINMFLAIFVHRTAETYSSANMKSMVVPQLVIAHSPAFSYPGRNGHVVNAQNNGSTSSAVYTNESFTSDEKY